MLLLLLVATSPVTRLIILIDDRMKQQLPCLDWPLGTKPVPPNVFLDVLHNPFVKLPTEEDLAIPNLESELVVVVHATLEWTVPYLAYLVGNRCMENKKNSTHT